MKQLTIVLIFTIVLQLCTAPPVTKNKSEESEANENEIGEDKTEGLVS